MLNIDSVFEPGQAYVMFSRVQCIDQVFVLKNLNPANMRASRQAKEELERLEMISINMNPTPWHQMNHLNQIKVASLNCAGLLPHLKDLQVDSKLKEADIIALQETSLAENHTIPCLNGFTMQIAGRGKGKGVATLQKDGGNWEEIGRFENNMQILKCISQNLEVINVYRSSDKSLTEGTEFLLDYVNVKKPTLIIGDFNVCAKRIKNNAITQRLSCLGFQQLVKEATQVQGNVIDHVYWRDVNETWEIPIIERYSPYFSDHDAQLITLTLVRTKNNFN